MRQLHAAVLLGLLATLSAFGQQNSLTATTTSASMTASDRSFKVASATNISAGVVTAGTVGTQLYVVDVGQTVGETMNVLAISGTTVTVSRTSGAAVAHASGAMVLAGSPNWFYKYDPTGTCTAATVYVSPWVNSLNGREWKCSSKTGTWTAFWGNTGGSPQILTATATTMAAGATTINGPLIKTDTGTNATTSFVMSAGWNGQGFCIIPGGAFTVTASNNIEKAATAVADRTLCFTWNADAAAFAPSY